MTDDEYATWDAPYVLGTLERNERLAYEAHLAICPRCRDAVGELAGLPGLLGRVDAEVALALVDPSRGEPDGARVAEVATKSPDLLPLLAHRTRAQRRRGRLLAVGGAVAAAAAAVIIAVPITATVTQHSASPATQHIVAERQLEPVAATPVSASFKVIDAGGKATVEMSCRYAPGGLPYQAGFELWATSRTGGSAKLMGWSAGPGEALTMTRTTELAPDQIASLEVRTGGGATILRATL
ncbi:zf-HC2 domain-containing protein [Nocardia sp. CDC159]|uniref:Zf-HC2 domain-containing protein n=1 Tax=Nocardia pulmonis TaxID=2951408 RepID=A0A9X2EBX6_9NOCA|nr:MULTISPECIES: zf-HC2 domain-containing protein [Nocardia]MCM6777485.1 zf-HC2 domain-containing protein [Nocardia pulmonis]MCM6790408.1 zf-HC2 domain-containing protein [Nocardia sp. CDC159]